MRKKHIIFILIICLFNAYLLVASIGFAYFNQNLNINGVASTLEFYEGDKLPANLVLKDPAEGKYYVGSGNFNNTEFVSETWNGDEYTLRIKRKGVRLASQTLSYSITIINDTVFPWTNGKISTRSRGIYLNVTSVSSSLSTTTVMPGEQVEVTINIAAYWPIGGITGNLYFDSELTFNMDGETKHFYLTHIYQ